MSRFRKICLLVLDSCGVGELPDAAEFGDAGSNTIGNCADRVGGLNMPNMSALGLGNIVTIKGVPPTSQPQAYYGKMAERSAGKDSTVGHWELCGIISRKPFPLFPDGFPREVIEKFKGLTGREVVGNVAASGTEIIAALGEEQLRTGNLIVYTSADSVFQVAAHLDVVPLEDLYRYCQLAREMLEGKYGVSRVIARPFTGRPGRFIRTPDRRDFSLEPPSETLLDRMSKAGYEVITVGKVDYLFAGRGVTEANHTKSNAEGIETTIRLLEKEFSGLLFINLVDFDMLWGHRNDVAGFARGLEYFDSKLPEITSRIQDDNLLIITADHGCDPTTPSTDHSREYVPLLLYSPRFRKPGTNLGVRKTFADLASTIAGLQGLPTFSDGQSFAEDLK